VRAFPFFTATVFLGFGLFLEEVVTVLFAACFHAGFAVFVLFMVGFFAAVLRFFAASVRFLLAAAFVLASAFSFSFSFLVRAAFFAASLRLDFEITIK
jgi:hypothetical protein